MFKSLIESFKGKQLQSAPEDVQQRHKAIALVTAGIFTLTGLTFFLYDVYMVTQVQQGRFDLADMVLMPVSAMMLVMAVVSLMLIWRGRISLGTELLFYFFVLVPPICAVLAITNIAGVAVSYLVILGSAMVLWVLPETSRRRALWSAVAALGLIAAVELWNPGFRVSSGMGGFATTVMALAFLAILVFLVRQAFVGKIRIKLIVSFVVLAILAAGGVGFFVERSSRASFSETIGNNLSIVSAAQSLRVGEALKQKLDQLDTLALSRAVQERAAAATAADHLSPEEIQLRDKQ
ncbi:MAG TPA: hypothetical protein VMJ64_04420, partial [Anaerolineales bacterium]|nr:hypothetical protein [Anaerolineales bacterium]